MAPDGHANHTRRFALPHALPIGARGMVYGIFQHTGNGAVVLRRNKQQSLGRPDLRLEAQHGSVRLLIIILVVERQVCNFHLATTEIIGCQLRQGMCQLAVMRIAPQATHYNGNGDDGFLVRHGGGLSVE